MLKLAFFQIHRRYTQRMSSDERLNNHVTVKTAENISASKVAARRASNPSQIEHASDEEFERAHAETLEHYAEVFAALADA